MIENRNHPDHLKYFVTSSFAGCKQAINDLGKHQINLSGGNPECGLGLILSTKSGNPKHAWGYTVVSL